MWIWLDKTGRVKQYLTHGPSPVVGETDFQIFAYFDGLNTDYFDSASIKFRKPDRQGSTYPVLFMRKIDLRYEYMPGDGDMSNFEDNRIYTGFLFDFSDFTEGDEIVRLLDTPGLWEATITLLGSPNKTNVSGLITFNVGSSASDYEDQTELSLDQVLENLILSQRILKKNSPYYLKTIPEFEEDARTGNLDVSTFSVGSIVLSTTSKNFYKILTITLNSDDDTKVFATYERVLEFLKIEAISDETILGEIYDLDNGNSIIVKFAGKYYLVYVNGNQGLVDFEIKDLTTGKRYNGSASFDTLFSNAISNEYYVPGTYYTPHVSEEGDLTWTNNNDEPNPDPVNIRGPQGEQGIQGPKGDDAIGALIFTIDGNGHLIMHWTNVDVDYDCFHVVNDDPSSPDYYETLGVNSSLIGHLICILD